ncbi:MAG: hypothetical protein M3N13_08020, partial [Candidatus Eremiobacteraeota bacterium]|nr:hypothetical protein [Candidatus Eremiobacteraeota bacterium]
MRIGYLLATAAFLFLLAVQGSTAQAASPLQLRSGTDIYYLRPAAEMLEDRTNALTVEQVAKETSFGPLRAMTNGNATYWVRFTASAQRTSQNEWYFFLGYKPRVADFYLPQPDGSFRVEHSGNKLPFRDRPVKAYGWIAFELPVLAKPQTFYTRIQTIEPNLTLAVDSGSFFWQQNQQQLLMMVGLGSVLLALALSSIILFGLARRHVYLYYAAYLFAQLFYRANDTGVAAAYFWPASAMSWTQLNVFFDGLTV